MDFEENRSVLKSGVVTAFLLLAGQTFAADLRVTDSSNAVVLVRDVVIDYGGFRNDRESEGIRVQQGEGSVIAKWSNIETLTMTGKDESVNPPRLNVDIVLKNGRKISAVMLYKGRMKLSGQTDLGDYSIDLDKVRSLAPVRTSTSGKTR
jgi:hypothetical protein